MQRELPLLDTQQSASKPQSKAHAPRTHLPAWFSVRLHQGVNYGEIRALTQSLGLHTICEEAHCPNIWECWNNRTATFMILGDICTRRCHYCSVTTGKPRAVDLQEPENIARAVKRLGLRHAVITAPNRDDLPDGGSTAFAETIHRIRRETPSCRIEVLIPDFKGAKTSLDIVLQANPDILNHNIETVPRLFPTVRPQGNYQRSIVLLTQARAANATTKSGIIVGMGESTEEIHVVLRDLRAIDCRMLTIGQYLQPTKAHRPVSRFYRPSEFHAFRDFGLALGFRSVESGPLVRSSYHAERQVEEVRR